MVKPRSIRIGAPGMSEAGLTRASTTISNKVQLSPRKTLGTGGGEGGGKVDEPCRKRAGPGWIPLDVEAVERKRNRER